MQISSVASPESARELIDRFFDALELSSSERNTHLETIKHLTSRRMLTAAAGELPTQDQGAIDILMTESDSNERTLLVEKIRTLHTPEEYTQHFIESVPAALYDFILLEEGRGNIPDEKLANARDLLLPYLK